MAGAGAWPDLGNKIVAEIINTTLFLGGHPTYAGHHNAYGTASKYSYY